MIEAAVMDVNAGTKVDHVSELKRFSFNLGRLERTGVSPVVGTRVGPGKEGISFLSLEKFK